MWEKQHTALGFHAPSKEVRVLTIYIDKKAECVLEVQQDGMGKIVKLNLDRV
jgi:hypothetical protein